MKSTREIIVQQTLKAEQEYIDMMMDDIFSRVVDNLHKKGAEYNKEENRLGNFLDVAAMDGITPEQALWDGLKKHIVALRKFIGEVGAVERPLSHWDDKVGNIVTYMVLLRSIISKRALINEAIKYKELNKPRPSYGPTKHGPTKPTVEETK